MKKYNVSLEMDQALFEFLIHRAEQLNISRSELLRLLLREDQNRATELLQNK